VAAENRLTSEQLAALAPGDTVTVEISGDFRRPRRSPGTVVRIEGPQVVISKSSARGVLYIERYSRRDGLRLGRGTTAQLVDGAADAPTTSEERRRQLRVDAAYRAWARQRGDVGKLRELQAAIAEALEESMADAD
jgi:hypothetical protein